MSFGSRFACSRYLRHRLCIHLANATFRDDEFYGAYIQGEPVARWQSCSMEECEFAGMWETSVRFELHTEPSDPLAARRAGSIIFGCCGSIEIPKNF